MNPLAVFQAFITILLSVKPANNPRQNKVFIRLIPVSNSFALLLRFPNISSKLFTGDFYKFSVEQKVLFCFIAWCQQMLHFQPLGFLSNGILTSLLFISYMFTSKRFLIMTFQLKSSERADWQIKQCSNANFQSIRSRLKNLKRRNKFSVILALEI